jgi:hypothetical protein
VPVQQSTVDGIVIDHLNRIKKLEDLLRSLGLTALILGEAPTHPGEVVIWTGMEWIPIDPPWLQLGAAPTQPGEIIVWNGSAWIPQPIPEDDDSAYLKLALPPAEYVTNLIPIWDGHSWRPLPQGGGEDLNDYTLINAMTDFSLWGATAGVVGDLVAEDSDAINAACAYCASLGGGEVELPANPPSTTTYHTIGPNGTINAHGKLAYRITKTVYVPPGVILKGQGTMATQIWADFSASTNWDAVQVGQISGSDFSRGQCGVRDLAILSGLGFSTSAPQQDSLYAGLATGVDEVLIENVVIGRSDTQSTNGPQVKDPIVSWGSDFAVGAALDMSTNGGLTVRGLKAVGREQGIWMGALSGSLGTPATLDDIGASGVGSGGMGLRVWWAQGVEVNSLVVASNGGGDIVIDGPDDGGPFPSKIRGTFVQGLTIRNVNTYSTGCPLVIITPIDSGTNGSLIQSVLIDDYQSNGVGGDVPIIVVGKKDTSGNDVALTNQDNFEAIWLKHFWVNGCGRIAYIGSGQGIYLEDSVFIDPLFTGTTTSPGIELAAVANSVTVSRNKLIPYHPGETVTSFERQLQYAVKINNGADRFVISENDFDPIVCAGQVNDLSTTTHKIINNIP